MKSLCDLKVGEEALVQEITSPADMKQRLWDLGFTTGTKVQCVQESPAGDPVAYRIRGTIIAIRKKDAKTVYMKKGDA
ncbi:MAG TPA: ferrous iron transport protein A [Candidatus Tetragenococcus pullicola]|nr:ferrous iron transport protein A [Candidatus Tetragenococcus pullicola]